MLPPKSSYPFAPDLPICRLLNGLWQVSGGHGHIGPADAITDMLHYHDAGFTTWDLADHYGPAEEFIGAFRRQLAARSGPQALEHVQAFTKWVPSPGPMTRQIVERAVDVSRRRMDTETLDLLQFHWWDYRDPRYLEALEHLAALRTTGKLRHLGLTNFDTRRLEIMKRQGLPIVANQVQYSLLDRRPAVAMVPFCQEQGIVLFTYGTLLGGLLSERWLGRPEPGPRDLTTASLRKYKQMIDTWGGWPLFQELLQATDQIAERHGVSIANIVVRAVLDRPAVAGVIVGARLGVTEHRAENARVFSFQLDAADWTRLDAVHARSRDLFKLIGDCGDEYRR
ncbi:MAG: aldo/keto reductase [Chloroflexi bacterium]|nr:aldo/keto reductase [Chloroflexota bacterium]